MTIPIWHAIGGQLVRTGRGSLGTDPLPTGLSATAGNNQVALSWSAPSPPTGVTDYAVQYKPASSSSWSTFAHTASTTTGRTVTGLTNGTAYDFRVAAVRSGVTGNYTASTRSTPRATTDPITIFGYNTNEKDTVAQTLAGRQAWWNGRAPCVRRYSKTFFKSGSWPVAQAVYPEKRISYSVKADGSGSFTKAGLAAGNGNDRLTSVCEDLPPDTKLWLTYHHEPNDEIRAGSLSIANYRDTYEQFRIAIDAASLQSGVEVFLTPNFMAFRVADTPTYFDDSWVPPLGVADLLSFDWYGNPGQFTAPVTGQGYGTGYPNVATRWRDTFEAIERNGFAAHWGILEMNTPGRDWDTSPIGEAKRRDWLVASVEYALNPPMAGSVPPEIFLFWEAPSGAQWNQAFGRVGGNPRTCANAIAPYILGTPMGG